MGNAFAAVVAKGRNADHRIPHTECSGRLLADVTTFSRKSRALLAHDWIHSAHRFNVLSVSRFIDAELRKCSACHNNAGEELLAPALEQFSGSEAQLSLARTEQRG